MFKRLLFILFLLLSHDVALGQGHQIETIFQVQVPSYLTISPITSPILTAHVYNNTGNLFAPLSVKYRVVTNKPQATLYLTAKTSTESGEENALFSQGNQVYMAFGNIQELPTSQALLGCKFGNESKGVVAYPVTSVYGANNKFISSKEKYEVYISSNGLHEIVLTVGPNVLRSSFDSKDKKGFYQTRVLLTEADI